MPTVPKWEDSQPIEAVSTVPKWEDSTELTPSPELSTGQRLLASMQKGSQDWLLTQGLQGIQRTTGLPVDPSFLKPPEGFEPEGMIEKGAELLTSLVDPAFLAVGGPLEKGAAKLIGGATKGLANLATRGAIEFGTIGAAQEAAKQFKEGQYDPSAILTKGLFSAGAGVVMRPAFDRALSKIFSKKAPLSVQEQFERKLPSQLPDEEFVLYKKRLTTKESITKELEEVNAKLVNTPKTSELGRQLTNKTGELELHLNFIETKLKEFEAGPQFQKLNKIKLEHEGTKIGDVPVDEFIFAKMSHIPEPEEVTKLLGANNLSSNMAATDAIRAAQIVDGEIRGVSRVNIVEPVLAAKLEYQKAYAELVKNHVPMLETIDKLHARNPEAFANYLEKSIGIETLSHEEVKALEVAKEFFARARLEINQTRARNGQKLIAEKEGYIPRYITEIDMADLNAAQKIAANLGFKVQATPAKVKGITAPATEIFLPMAQRRTGNSADALVDPVTSLLSYMNYYTRVTKMTDAGAKALSYVRWLKPEAQNYFINWLGQTAFGRSTKVDQMVLEYGLGNVLKATELYSGTLAMGNILMSLNVIKQQPSQIIATIMETGLGSTLTGLAKAPLRIPEHILKKSYVLQHRSVRDEMPQLSPTVLKTFQKWGSAVMDVSDRFFARASWHAGFEKASKQWGWSEDASIRFADDVARRLHAVYDDALRVPMLRGRTGKALLPFQTFMFNLWQTVTKDPKIYKQLSNRSALSGFTKAVGAMVATDMIYESLGLTAPFQAKEVTPVIPIVGSAKYGFPSPVINAVQNEIAPMAKMLGGDPSEMYKSVIGNLFVGTLADDPDKRQQAQMRLKKSLAGHFPGGKQIFNTVEGYYAWRDGVAKIGQEEINIDGLDKLRAVLFGPSKTVAATERLKETFSERREGWLE